MEGYTLVFFSNTQRKRYVTQQEFNELTAKGSVYRICGKYIV